VNLVAPPVGFEGQSGAVGVISVHLDDQARVWPVEICAEAVDLDVDEWLGELALAA
jgi:hypothetical protein